MNSEKSAHFDYAMVFKMEGEKPARKIPDTAKFIVDVLQKSKFEIFSYLSVQGDELLVLLRADVLISNSCYYSKLTFLYINFSDGIA